MSAVRKLQEYDFDYNEILGEPVNKTDKKLHKKEKQSNLFLKLACVVSIVLIFGIMTALLFRYAKISETKYNIYSLKKEIKELNIKKEELYSELDSIIALSNVEKIAIEELNMIVPSPRQIVYINSSSDYTISDGSIFDREENDDKDEKVYDFVKLLANKVDKVFK